jgi:thiol-disulfide isomerase/thioredoxin
MAQTKTLILKFFTKQNCSLCETAKQSVLNVSKKVPFEIAEIDIMRPENKEWHDRFVFDIPVGCVGNKQVFQHRVDEADLVNQLKLIAREGSM